MGKQSSFLNSWVSGGGDPNNFIPKWLLNWGMCSKIQLKLHGNGKRGGVKKTISKKRVITLAGHWCVIPSGKQHYDPKQQKPFPTLISKPAKISYVNKNLCRIPTIRLLGRHQIFCTVQKNLYSKCFRG